MTHSLIRDAIRREGPLTVARFMELALYDPQGGYYAGAPRRSGRAGDFYTSVDVGPLFGNLLAVQFHEMWRLLGSSGLDLVEAGASDGRLACDVLDAAALLDPAFYEAIRLHLVEGSPAARAAQAQTLDAHRARVSSRGPDLPGRVNGIVYANELLDALPVHQVVMREDGLREVFVQFLDDRLVTIEGPPSTAALAAYLREMDVRLRPGWRAEIGLAAVDWVRRAAGALDRGFMVLIDYGHEAAELYSATHAAGTLTTYDRHTVHDAPAPGAELGPPWLQRPGRRDITAHVNLTAVHRAAAAEGLESLGMLDQTYFLLGLGIADRLAGEGDQSVRALRQRQAAKALIMPGGLGSTQKVIVLGRAVGRPALRGCSFRPRMT